MRLAPRSIAVEPAAGVSGFGKGFVAKPSESRQWEKAEQECGNRMPPISATMPSAKEAALEDYGLQTESHELERRDDAGDARAIIATSCPNRSAGGESRPARCVSLASKE